MAFEEFESAVRTDIGRSRGQNEDAVLALPEHGVFCVADGIGGAAGGAMASQRVVEAVRAAFSEVGAEASLDRNIERLREAVARADAEIKEWADQRESVGTGTTLVAVVFDPTCPYFGSVLHAGDSRAYRYRQGKLSRLSSDHSIANALGLDEDENIPSIYHGVITHAIGAQEATLEENTFDVEEGDLFLLCSDGLTRMVSDTELEDLLLRHCKEDLAALVSRMVDRANEAGGVDNISVVLVRVGDHSSAEAPVAGELRDSATRMPALSQAERSTAPAGPAVSDVRPLASTPHPAPPPRLEPVAPRSTPPADRREPRNPPVPERPQAPSPSGTPMHRPVSAASASPSRRVYATTLGILLAAGFCLGCLYLALHLLHADREATDAAEPAATEFPADRAAIADAQRRVEAALASGEWGALKLTDVEDLAATGRIRERATPGDSHAGWLNLSEKVRYDEIYRSWLYLWEKIRYSDWPQTNRMEYLASSRLMDAIGRSLGVVEPLGIREEWPESQEAQADFVCRESYRLQQALLKQVAVRIDRDHERLKALRENRPMILRAVCALGTGEEGCTERIGAAVVAAESRILALHEWIGMRGVFPLDPDVLAEIADATLPAIGVAMDKVGALLQENLRALSAERFREVCGADGISDREIENLLWLRDRLLATSAVEEDTAVGDWFSEVNPQQLGFFLQRLARKCPAE